MAMKWRGGGDDDHCQAGRYFGLANRWDEAGLGADQEDNRFLLLEVRHTINNNYAAKESCPAEYANELIALRKKIPWRPGRGYNSEHNPVLTVKSAIQSVNGDCGSGGISGTSQDAGNCEVISGSPGVRAEGKPVARNGDKVRMNNRNTWGYLFQFHQNQSIIWIL